MSTKILAICGSLRNGSFNKKLMLTTCEQLRQVHQCEVTILDLRSLELPIYDGDLEEAQGMPPGGQKLVDAIIPCNGLLVASPEYNGSLSGALKNAIDWASRAEKNPFVGKIVMLEGTSIGWFGAVRSLMHARLILSHLRANVISSQLTIPLAETAFTEAGELKDEVQRKLMKSACSEFVKFAQALQ